MITWIRVHWFEVSCLFLLALNFWFVTTVLSTLRATNEWLTFLARLQEDREKSKNQLRPPADC
jgi:hypothetical protein